MRTIRRPLGLGMCLGLVHQVRYPRCDRLNQNLRAFALKEIEHVEVAVTFGELRPELARDLYHRLHLGAIHLNRVKFLAGSGQGVEIVIAPEVLVHLAKNVEGIAENLVALKLGFCPIGRGLLNFERVTVFQITTEPIHRLTEYFVGLAFVHFEWTNLVDQIVDHVAQVHRVQHAESEVDGELQSWLTRGRFDPVAVLEEQHSETIEARILQREAILGLIHPEAARAAGTGSEENIVIQNVLARNAFLFQKLEILHQISHREICWVALPVVTEFLTRLECRHVGYRQLLAAISTALEHGANQIFVLPGKSPEQDCHLAAFFSSKCALHRTVEVCWLVKPGNFPQTHALGFKAFLNF